MENKTDCSFIEGKDRFRYRVGGIVVCGGYALFGVNEKCDYYYTVGGGVHMGEKTEDAILRELYEETGVRMSIIHPLCLVENFLTATVYSRDLIATFLNYTILSDVMKEKISTLTALHQATQRKRFVGFRLIGLRNTIYVRLLQKNC